MPRIGVPPGDGTPIDVEGAFNVTTADQHGDAGGRRVAVITGAGGGLGSAVARLLAQAGDYRLCLVDNRRGGGRGRRRRGRAPWAPRSRRSSWTSASPDEAETRHPADDRRGSDGSTPW